MTNGRAQHNMQGHAAACAVYPKHLPQGVEACLAHETNWEGVEQPLKRVMGASPVGAKMFWAGAQYLQNSRSMATIQKAIAALGEGLDVKGLADALQQVNSDVSNSGVDMCRGIKRESVMLRAAASR